ncbi:hypothetical protein C479_13368 [Halovivax asiaticus JCM 14624]|uniref:DUF1917 domain-containing protein n=1 Tax=Halovivax asiaticus JCM 14624 TaxID=1227490 RepID=M0BBN6_9EURY|nr:putative phosphothreonine lyase domain-containg protein [Halovivax asiaticus]ELZ08331.1 hypothetical protein C479_13368 [Halovivax asiaticus JCM 14624]
MAGTHPPSEEVEQYWIYAQGDRQDYYEAHDVLKQKDMTANDIPESDNDTVRELDEEALQHDSPTSLSGKWNVFLKPAEIDDVWGYVTELVKENEIYSAKVTAKYGREEENRGNHVIVVYTPNYFDKEDVFRVRELLRNKCGIEETLYYKPDIYTRKGIYADTAQERGLPGASRYFG